MTRRDTLLATLERALERTPPALEEDGSIRLQTLFSVPRRINSVYPWAHVGDGEPVATWQEHVVITAGWEPHGGSERLFYALELYVYTIPAQSAALVYVSKLDSTGFGPPAYPSNIRQHLDGKERDSPSLTTTLTAAAIEHFASRRHWETSVNHIALHIFARSQAAYLFPASPNNKNKRILSDTALIRWWRACISEAIHAVPVCRTDAYYVLPGIAQLDSRTLVPLPHGADRVSAARWKYGHPYSEEGTGGELPPLPLHPQPDEARSSNGAWFPLKLTLATTIPIFPDDPKGRFVRELANQAHEPGVARPSGLTHTERAALMERQALDRTSIDAYWEGLGFRQECSSGNIAGVFIVGFTGNEVDGEREAPIAQAYALPHPMLSDLVLEYIQQDKCDWSGEDAPRLTHRYYEAVDRALRRKGGLGNAPEGHSARGKVWTCIQLQAIKSDARTVAQERAARTDASRSGATSCVHTLTVKRRRK